MQPVAQNRTVLIVDDDAGTLATFCAALALQGHRVVCAASAAEGITKGRRLQPDVALVDLHLPDQNGSHVVKTLRYNSPHTAVIVMTGFASVRSAVEVMRLGATDYIEKPIDIDGLSQIVTHSGASTEPTGSTPDIYMHSAVRWVNLILRTRMLPSDPNTVELWAHELAVSPGAIRGWCRTASVAVKPTLNAARMIRVISLFQPGCRLPDLLNIVDSRTLERFLMLGRRGGPQCRLPITLEQFFAHQQWITNPAALMTLRSALGLSSS
jgi:ActR/RegA family two-component response regulator